ncbi:MAG: NlpC/P60 family protein, partial [Actinomycetes bacterium]
AEMDDLKNQIAALARQAYIAGGENTQLAVLLNTQDPSQFAEQLVALRRTSQSNQDLFHKLEAKQAELAATLATLKDLQDAAAEEERQAQARADDVAARAAEVAARAAEVSARAADAQAARDRAAASKQSVVDLVATREAKRADALALRRKLAAQYEELQGRLVASSGTARTAGTRRNATQAIAWGMQFVGSGAEYDGLCLGFVDDAYSPYGERMPTAIAQWYRARDAGKGHSWNGNPPVGAEVFWETPGYDPGHVAIYAGGGMILTTSAFGGLVGLRTVGSMEAWLGSPVGWAEPYYP